MRRSRLAGRFFTGLGGYPGRHFLGCLSRAFPKPLAGITSALAIMVVLVFFITSSDSGSLIIDSITAGGKVDAPVTQRIFWAALQGVIAGVLLYGGGSEALTTLQAGSLAATLPFTPILLLMCVSLYKGLKTEIR
jgi:BCCT family betaine/carnitine transporter